MINLFELILAPLLEAIELILVHEQLDLSFEVVDAVCLCALIDLVLELPCPAVVALVVELRVQLDKALVDSVELVLAVLHGLPHSVDPRIQLVARSVELVTAQRLAPDQVHFLQRCLLRLTDLCLQILLGHEL